MTRPEAMHFDEWAGIYYIVEALGVPYWQQDVIFDLSFHMYRTRDEVAPGRDPRRYAWEDGEVCEYRLERGRIERRTAMLVHLQKRTMRAPSADVLRADHYWILANGFTVQHAVTPWSVRAARLPMGHELVPFHLRRVQRAVRRRPVLRVGPVGDGRCRPPPAIRPSPTSPSSSAGPRCTPAPPRRSTTAAAAECSSGSASAYRVCPGS